MIAYEISESLEQCKKEVERHAKAGWNEIKDFQTFFKSLFSSKMEQSSWVRTTLETLTQNTTQIKGPENDHGIC